MLKERNGYQQFFDKIDKVYILNLLTRKDRKQRMLKMLLNMGLTDEITNGKIEFVCSVPLPCLSPEVLEYMNNCNKGNFYNNVTQSYSVGTAMCAIEHFRILKMAQDGGYHRVLILEDDACFHKSEEMFKNAADTLPEQFSILHLEGFYFPVDENDWADHEGKLATTPEEAQWKPSSEFYLWASAALMYSQEGIERIISRQEEMMMYYDYYTLLETDNSYYYNMPLVIQAIDYSDITGKMLDARDNINVYMNNVKITDYYD